MSDIVVGVLAIAGGVLVLLAGIGVLRFPDLYARMHATTKATSVAIGLICLAGAIAIDGGASKLLLAAGLIFNTAPTAAHFIGRSAYRVEGVDVDLDGRDDLIDLLRDGTEPE